MYLYKDHNEDYISISEAAPYANKRYHCYAAKLADQEITAIKKYLKAMPDVSFEEAFSQMPDVIKPLITPVIMTNEDYARKWQEEKFIPKRFDPKNTTQFYTKKGERVRSKSEVIIANMLYDLGIPYKYEKPLLLYDGMMVIHPDFTILNIRTREEFYLEHAGRMDDPSYCQDLVLRLKYYQDNGIYFGEKLLFTCETEKDPLSTKDLEDFLRHFFL
ncbi:MAG: hypothetical protein J5685_03025 [Clostridiales bacterium]|nr:hypothetical protein [Clostridiales bacterium]